MENKEKTSKVRYYLFEEKLGQYTTYGIGADNNENIMLHDVSVDREFAENLVRMLNEGEAAPVQLAEIIEDMLP